MEFIIDQLGRVLVKAPYLNTNKCISVAEVRKIKVNNTYYNNTICKYNDYWQSNILKTVVYVASAIVPNIAPNFCIQISSGRQRNLIKEIIILKLQNLQRLRKRGTEGSPVASYIAWKGKAFSIAAKAAQEAKAASDAQMPAAENAAQLVKVQLAEKAVAAAKAAKAALAGKQQIVEQLDMEVREGELAVRDENAYLQCAQGNCEAASLAAKQAGLQLKALKEAMASAKSNVENSEQASNGAEQEVLKKQQLVEAAKSRVEILLRQLDSAQNDYRATKKAAERACSAAQEAKLQAARQRRMVEVFCKLRHINLKE